MGKVILELIFPKTLAERRIDQILQGEIELPSWRLSAARLSRRVSFFPELVYLYAYGEHDMRLLMWHYKYKGDRRIGRFLALHLQPRLVTLLKQVRLLVRLIDGNKQAPILIALPSSWRRKMWRGFSQTEYLAQELLKCIKNKKMLDYASNVLVKSKSNEGHAKTKNKDERREHISGSFVVKKPEKIRDRTIILLDDVVTTGSTLQEATRVLKAAGARRVVWLAVAH